MNALFLNPCQLRTLSWFTSFALKINVIDRERFSWKKDTGKTDECFFLWSVDRLSFQQEQTGALKHPNKASLQCRTILLILRKSSQIELLFLPRPMFHHKPRTTDRTF